MKREDLPRLTACLKRLCAIFNRFYSEALLEGYTVGLRDADIVAVEANAIAWLTIGKAMPTPYDLSRPADAVSVEREALSAWSSVLAMISSRDYTSGDALVDELVAGFGGYHRIGQLPTEQVNGFIRREFVQAYIAASRDEELRSLSASLRDHPPQLPA